MTTELPLEHARIIERARRLLMPYTRSAPRYARVVHLPRPCHAATHAATMSPIRDAAAALSREGCFTPARVRHAALYDTRLFC